jgi:hypothetical protein
MFQVEDGREKACPEFETPNQFGEICARCRREIQIELQIEREEMEAA